MESYKVRNPKSGRLINVNGDIYNKLIRSGEYTREQLLLLPVTPFSEPRRSSKKKVMTNMTLPDEIIFEEILMKTDNPDFISICRSNKKFQQLCNNDIFWKRLYNKYYGDTNMEQEVRKNNKNISYYELFKICYNLSLFLEKVPTLSDNLITLYNAKSITLHHSNILKFIKFVPYLKGLKKITINIPAYNPEFIVSFKEFNELPLLTTIEYKKY